MLEDNAYLRLLFINGLGLGDCPACMPSLEKACHLFYGRDNSYANLVKWVGKYIGANSDQVEQAMQNLDNHISHGG